MIEVRNSPRSAGAVILGDQKDFSALYASLHTIVGEEGQYRGYDSVRIRVLAVCYDLRHALSGNRNVELVANGMTREIAIHHAVVCPPSNVYLSFNVLWPEMLFVLRALHEFARLYVRSLSKDASTLDDRSVVWDEHINRVRSLQIAVVHCLKSVMSAHSFRRLLNVLLAENLTLENYTTQYIDLLNVNFLNKDERSSHLLRLALRLFDKGKEYQKVTAEVKQAALWHQTSPENIDLNLGFPDTIDW